MHQKILLIDDDNDEQVFFTEALHQIDTPVNFFFAQGATKGLEMIKLINPDFIFIDFNMPVMDGLACLEKVVQEGSHQHAKIVIYSTGLTDDLCQSALSKGAWNCIKKPTSIYDLVTSLKSLFTSEL